MHSHGCRGVKRIEFERYGEDAGVTFCGVTGIAGEEDISPREKGVDVGEFEHVKVRTQFVRLELVVTEIDAAKESGVVKQVRSRRSAQPKQNDPEKRRALET